MFRYSVIVPADALPMAKSGLPSPSKSAITARIGPLPTPKSNRNPKDELVIVPAPGNVGSNGASPYAVSPFPVSVIGPYVAPTGTTTTRFVPLAAVTTACTAPNRTILLVVTGLKLAP